jgi:hypothetical protein
MAPATFEDPMTKLRNALVRFVVGFSMLVGLLGLEPGFAQVLAPSKTASLPQNDQLDALLAARKWNDLSEALRAARDSASVGRMLDWLRARIDAGGGFMLTFVYALKLWQVGNLAKNDDPMHDLRISSGFITMYSYELIVIDGAKCGDRSAPSHRLDQLFMSNGAALAYLKGRPDDFKAKLVEGAIAMEKKTAPWRPLDDLLCRDGLEQMQAGIKAGTTHEVPNTTGHFGKTVAVETPPGWEPRILPPEQYTAQQEEARRNMKAALLKLIQ